MANIRNWPIAPVHLRPLKPAFAKTATNSPTTAKADEATFALVNSMAACWADPTSERPRDGPGE